MELQELKQKCLAAIDANAEKIIGLGQELYKTPELGYKEFQTQKSVEEAFEGAGFEVEKNLAYTGCRAHISKKEGPTVGVIGELDCIMCSDHPDSRDGGNVHACGHNVQLANLYGCALGLKESGVLDMLGGNVEFLAVPAEECVDYDYRNGLIRQGEIQFYGGKQELVRRGTLDGTDLFLQCHMMEMPEGKRCTVDTDCNGFMTKTVLFVGKAAHAGFSPHEGINALGMAQLALNNINAVRETFRDEDKVRVSAILTEGGELVNVVPSTASMQIMVRAFTVEAILDASEKIDRALKAGALALGGKVEIHSRMGYLPMRTDRKLSALYRENMIRYAGADEDSFVERYETAGSTDLGDLSQMKPCMHIWTEGVTGGLHSKDYRIADLEKAYLQPARMLALTVVDLLYKEAEKASQVLDAYHPVYTKEEYLHLLRDHSGVEIFDETGV